MRTRGRALPLCSLLAECVEGALGRCPPFSLPGLSQAVIMKGTREAKVKGNGEKIFFFNSKIRQKESSKILLLNSTFSGAGEKLSNWSLNPGGFRTRGNLPDSVQRESGRCT